MSDLFRLAFARVLYRALMSIPGAVILMALFGIAHDHLATAIQPAGYMTCYVVTFLISAFLYFVTELDDYLD